MAKKRGNQLFGKHQTVPKDLKHAVMFLEGIPEVTKVILGRPAGCRHSFPLGHLKVARDEPVGIMIKGYSDRGVIDFHVCLQNPNQTREAVKSAIEKRYPGL